MTRGQWIRIALALLVAAVVVAWALGTRRYDHLLAATERGWALGEVDARSRPQGDCIPQLAVRYPSCDSTECELSANGYIGACMKVARPDGFCAQVPTIRRPDAALAWVAQTCRDHALGHDRCLDYMHVFVRLCTEQITGRKLTQQEILQYGYQRGRRRDGQ